MRELTTSTEQMNRQPQGLPHSAWPPTLTDLHLGLPFWTPSGTLL